MIYNLNLGIGKASSGVEYAQAYRASIFRQLNFPTKFIFTDMIVSDNIAHLTEGIGFKNDEIIWLYSFFTDMGVHPTTYTKEELVATFMETVTKVEETVQWIRYSFNETGTYVTAYLVEGSTSKVHRVEYVSEGILVRKDYYTFTRIFTEYYAPNDKKAKVYLRRFFQQDGSVAYEELCDGQTSVFRFPNELLYSKEQLVAKMIQMLELTADDILILDRSTGIGQAVLEHKKEAKVGVVIHAEHYNQAFHSPHHLLWNNFYDYQFTHRSSIDFFITATQAQKNLLQRQFDTYQLGEWQSKIFSIAVGSLDELRYPMKERERFSLMTASRLATEKHVDWLVEAVVMAKQEIPQLSLAIFGKGGQEVKLRQLIEKHQAQDYIHLKGHHDLTNLYTHYEGYISASTSEGFGLTLMEAVGSGLAMVGLDVPYGNQTFIGKDNGYLIDYDVTEDAKKTIEKLYQAIVRLFKQDQLDRIHAHSYEIASDYLTSAIAEQWQEAVKEVLTND